MFDPEQPRRAGVDDNQLAYLHTLFTASIRAGRHDDARDLAETLVQLDPFSSTSWTALAESFRGQDKPAQAAAAEEFARCLL